MLDERILRLKRAEDDVDSFVLLHVVEEGSLLHLTASEGEFTYRCTVKLDSISRLRHQLYCGTDNELGVAIRRSLLVESERAPSSTDYEKTDFVAEIHKADKAKKINLHMSLVWRRKIAGINSKLGQIDLPEFIASTPEQDVDPFEWANIAARNFDDSRKHVGNLETQLATQSAALSQLQTHLDTIVQAKADHEGLLLQKFAELIRSKKAKIRDQQRLLSTAQVDPAALVRIAPFTLQSRHADESRSCKRKANIRAAPSDDESSDGFEDAIPHDRGQEIDMQDTVTPEDTEDDTEDDEAEKPAPKPVKTGLRRLGNRAAAVEREKTETPELPPASVPARSIGGNSKAPEKASEDDVPPPKRELPFARKKIAEPEPNATKDDDETDDDEL